MAAEYSEMVAVPFVQARMELVFVRSNSLLLRGSNSHWSHQSSATYQWRCCYGGIATDGRHGVKVSTALVHWSHQCSLPYEGFKNMFSFLCGHNIIAQSVDSGANLGAIWFAV
jgi:hypothetical protein